MGHGGVEISMSNELSGFGRRVWDLSRWVSGCILDLDEDLASVCVELPFRGEGGSGDAAAAEHGVHYS